MSKVFDWRDGLLVRTLLVLSLTGVFGWTGLILPSAGWAAETDDDDELPEPEELDLWVSDGLKMHAIFYPGTRGKKTVPVIILHEKKAVGSDYEGLALYLQSQGRAVLVPDLRGCGNSNQIFSKKSKSKSISIHVDRLSKKHVSNMVKKDFEKLKSFLIEKNNEGELNIEKLCIIGVGTGAPIGLNWAVRDWNWDSIGANKQGKDVRAMVLISPELNFRGLKSQAGLVHRDVGALSTMYIVGEKNHNKTFAVADRLHRISLKKHPDNPNVNQKVDKTLFLKKKETTLQGASLVNDPQFQVPQLVNGFIIMRLVKKKDPPWRDRTRP